MNRLLSLLAVVLAARTPAAVPEESPSLPEAPPPVDLSLRIETAPPPGDWKLVITNGSAVPVRLGADGRLLRLEIDNPNYTEPTSSTPKRRRTEPQTIQCSLPSSMTPSQVTDERALSLPPGGRYEESFPPALFCFGERQRSLLASGARVTPKLGFVSPPRPSNNPSNKKKGPPEAARPPFIAEPLTSNGSYSPVKEIVGTPFTAAGSLDAPRPLPDSPTTNVVFDIGAPRLDLSLRGRVDAVDPDAVEVTATLKNLGKRSAWVRMRRDSLLFTVETPSGMVTCGALPNTRSIPPDLLSQLAGGASESVAVRLAEHCPDNTFERPGLYRVWAKVVLPDAGGKVGQRVLSTSAESTESAQVRVQTGKYPYYADRPAASVVQTSSTSANGSL